VTDRLSSGQPRLDAILGGGLPADAINLIAGPPGSGKLGAARLESNDDH
jgi:circadian clock protein KaiC